MKMKKIYVVSKGKDIEGNTIRRDLVDKLYKTAYKRYREKYPKKRFCIYSKFFRFTLV